MKDRILTLRRYVQFDFYTVNNMYCLQLFDKNVSANDGIDCIYEDSDEILEILFDDAIEWCKERYS